MARGIGSREKQEKLYAAAKQGLPEQLAPCRHYHSCGGCDLQELSYEHQLEAKRRSLAQLIQSRGFDRFFSGVEHEMVASPQPFHYRQRMDFAVAANAAGLRHCHNPRAIVATPECLLNPEPSQFVFRRCAEACARLGIPAYDSLKHSGGDLRYIIVRRTRLGQQLLCLITATQDHSSSIESLAQEFIGDGSVHSFHWIVSSGKADISVGDSFRHWGSAFIEEEILGKRFVLGPSTFFQSNAEVASLAYGAIRDAVESVRPELLLDLYSGTCTMALVCGESARRIVAVENFPDNVFMARRNAAAAGITHLDIVEQDVKDFLATWTEVPGFAILNPPRAGMEEMALRRILDLAPGRLAYLSCHPASLLDDLGILARRYRPTRLVQFDMFPQTWHFETLVLLERV
jgi:23S rRNA (uracil-5-)-methyltransferase RumA